MNSLDSLYGESFYQQLQQQSAEAFINSAVSNDRRKLGRIAYGNAQAMWRTKRGGTAVLGESGVRIGAMPLGNPLPTELWLAEPVIPEETSPIELTMFAMDLEAVGSIEVTSTTITEGRILRQLITSRLHRIAAFINVEEDTCRPSQEQKLVLLEELQRGASGEHALLDSSFLR